MFRTEPQVFFALLLAATPTFASYTLFESDPVRPLAIAPSADRLFVVNTPDAHLEIFNIDSTGLQHVISVPVGMEPVAVAARNDNEVWIVNHLSDSVSIVDVSQNPPRVVRTLLVGDEPRDIVFAGPGRQRAFITTAHRGQNSPYVDPGNPGESTTPGIGRADVWVFDAANPGVSIGGDPLTVVTLFADKPRALAATPDGSTVFAAAYLSGNGTTTVYNRAVCDGGLDAMPCSPSPGEQQAPGGLPEPNQDSAGNPQPEVGLIVRNFGGQWLDEIGRDWSSMVRFDLPDFDVFAIDAMANPPVRTAEYSAVGTVLFNMAVNPANGNLYVSNTEAGNEIRFEGTREPGDDVSSVVGNLHRARITIIETDGTVLPRHLNKHIDYEIVPAPLTVEEKSLSLPLGMAVSKDGQTLYVAAMGSDKIGILSTAALKDDSFVPDEGDHIAVSGGGPTGLVLDQTRQRLYVSTRFDNGVSVIDLDAAVETTHLTLSNPEPDTVKNGRRFLYDARLSSSNGETSCASCHVFGDMDGLAWDLGDPNGSVTPNPNPGFVVAAKNDLHPMKGPMATQSLRGMDNHGPMHWRGDRSGALAGSTFDDEVAAFLQFNPAFVGLLGNDSQLDAADMEAFAEFVLSIRYPPNPIRRLDNQLTTLQAQGRDFFFGSIASDFGGQLFSCNGCHRLDTALGFFGTEGNTSFIGAPQDFKIPHLRNLYQKVGMFGMPAISNLTLTDNTHMGNQIRGFGFFHDGSVDTLKRFHSDIIFTPQAHNTAAALEQFALAFDSEIRPIVGQQVTLDAALADAAADRIDLLIDRAAGGDCDLIVKGIFFGVTRGAVRISSGVNTGKFRTDLASQPLLEESDIRAAVNQPGGVLTYTCVPVGSGVRMGIDRDNDGLLDGDDKCLLIENPAESEMTVGRAARPLPACVGRGR